MTELILPAAILLASVTLTYLFCVRPMLKGHCAHGHPAESMDRLASSTTEATELTRLRAELATLRVTPLNRTDGTSTRA
ncbi:MULTISPECIES: hypothetical protein [Cryobacterium]|uniref:Uncharacterized protein n=1 Tax=Cryobacterium mannosilyticum TaxID=1259190 RepID=A0A4R8WC58_9MICO|nr:MULTISPECIES: hypothetical protein [Cryobacterium]TFB92558.1 hypothetical protein E3O48_12255 [Cryobacterium sp. HLT2-28]TFC06826.1 hypothetical protein E3O32_03755 [Cryobacterium mannosilyticum]